MKQEPSTNFNERTSSGDICYVVLHYTGMKDAQSALTRMCDPTTKVSAHYMIDEDGNVTQLVDESKRAWHAGVSFWAGETDLNSLSIGIELVNPGHEFGYRPFPSSQIRALKDLLTSICARHQLDRACLLAHSDIAIGRREDPGELFPWQELAEAGYGYWPSETGQNDPALPFNPETTRRLLRLVGYDCPDNDETKASLAQTAFLRRYHPEQLNKGFSQESFVRLAALTKALTTAN